MQVRQLTGIVCMLLMGAGACAQEYNITDFGAVGDGATINTQAIQAAIDKCGATGGRVLVPEGTFLSGTLYLRSNVEIHIEEKGVLKGSPFFKDYPVNNVQYKNAFNHDFNGSISLSRAFIFAEGVHHISLTGKGSINGSGDSPEFNLGNDGSSAQSRQRPCMLLIVNCKNIKVYDLFLTNSAYWLENYIGCDTLHVKGIRVYNHTNYNQDGIDIDARNVLVEDCTFDVDDDGICFKSHERKHIVENVVVSNCTISSNCNAIKFGTLSIGGLKNVSITHCTISKASADHIRHWQQNLQFIEQPVTVISGIALEAVDGAIVEDVTISDITMKDVQTPVFIVLGNRSRKPVGDSVYRAGQIKNVTIKNITAVSHSRMPASITAFPGHYVENVTLENIRISSTGGGTLQEAGMTLPENPKAYPENRMYAQVYPAGGLYLRHVKGITLKNMQLTVRKDDYRPAVIIEDARNVKLDGALITSPKGNTEAVRVISSRAVILAGVQLTDAATPLYRTVNMRKKQVKVVKQ